MIWAIPINNGSTMSTQTDQLDHIPYGEWKRKSREAKLRLEAEHRHLAERLQAVDEQLGALEEEEQEVSQAMRRIVARLNAPSDQKPLPGSNLREVLIINFADADGKIVGEPTVDALVDLEYFSDRRTAFASVYTVLAKPPFEKIDRGMYRVPTNSSEWQRLRPSNGSRRQTNKHVLSHGKRRAEQEILAVSLAQERDGRLRYSDVNRLVEAHPELIADPRHVGFDVRHILRRTGPFERVERGLYRLKDFQGEKLRGLTEATSNVRMKPSDLAGISQPKALIKIAEANEDILVVPDAKRLFIEAGLSKSKFVSQGIRARIHRMNERFQEDGKGPWWERVGPGRHRLDRQAEDMPPGRGFMSQPRLRR